jgi:hypothetical protein
MRVFTLKLLPFLPNVFFWGTMKSKCKSTILCILELRVRQLWRKQMWYFKLVCFSSINRLKKLTLTRLRWKKRRHQRQKDSFLRIVKLVCINFYLSLSMDNIFQLPILQFTRYVLITVLESVLCSYLNSVDFLKDKRGSCYKRIERYSQNNQIMSIVWLFLFI